MMTGLLSLLIYLIILGLIIWVVRAILQQFSVLKPFAKLIMAIIYVFAALLVLALLIDLAVGLLGLPRLR